jgi:octaprenyl-diphosphate synthase
VVEIVSDRGGLDYARRRGDEYAREAEMALVDLPDTSARGALHDAIAYALDRSQ